MQNICIHLTIRGYITHGVSTACVCFVMCFLFAVYFEAYQDEKKQALLLPKNHIKTFHLCDQNNSDSNVF